MNTNIFKSAIAALALFVVFNSCKEDDDSNRMIPEVKLEKMVLMEDGFVATSLSDLFFFDEEKSEYKPAHGVNIYVGTSPDKVDTDINTPDIIPYTKYYWKIEASIDGSSRAFEETPIRSFYYIPLAIELSNVSGDWATIVKWEHNDVFEDAQVTLVPDKECNYDKNPITVPAGQDSCYISAGELGTPKYQIYHSWWDNANGKYYEPVIYNYKLTINCNINGEIIAASTSAKGIFLNTEGYVADDNYMVYRFAKIGNRIWMLDDIRAKIPDTALYRTVNLASGLEMTLYSEKVLNEYEYIIPKGFHLATNDDWLDLEAHFGVEKTDINSYIRPNDHWGYTYGKDTNNYERRKKYYDIYVGSETNIRDYLITNNEWRDFSDSTKMLEGHNLFNAHPVGIPYYEWIHGNYGDSGDGGKGQCACFMTSTINRDIDDRELYVKRILGSGSTGIGRVVYYHLNEYHEYYLYRCVKDE